VFWTVIIIIIIIIIFPRFAPDSLSPAITATPKIIFVLSVLNGETEMGVLPEAFENHDPSLKIFNSLWLP
jgi:hypothetical protein